MGLNNIKINNTTNVKTGVVYDISKATGQSYETLSDALSGNNVPLEIREGGMSVRFVHTSENKYVQYRLMSNSFNTTVANWQGVNDVPAANSDNLVKSGGIYASILNDSDKQHILKTILPLANFVRTVEVSSEGKFLNIFASLSNTIYIVDIYNNTQQDIEYERIWFSSGGNDATPYVVRYGLKVKAGAHYYFPFFSSVSKQYLQLTGSDNWKVGMSATVYTITEQVNSVFSALTALQSSKESTESNMLKCISILSDNPLIVDKKIETTWTSGAIDSNGHAVSPSNYAVYSDYIPIDQGALKYYLNTITTWGWFEAYYTEQNEQSFISGQEFKTTTFQNIDLTIPYNAKYMRVTISTNSSTTKGCYVRKYNLLPQSVLSYITEEYGKEYYVNPDGFGDFTTFYAACHALKDDTTKKTIFVQGGVYDVLQEMGGQSYIDSIPSDVASGQWTTYSNFISENTKIVGLGEVTLNFFPDYDAVKCAVIGPVGFVKNVELYNITINASNCRYCIHYEAGTEANNKNAKIVLENVKLYKTIQNASGGYGQAFGAGHGNNVNIICKDCLFSSNNQPTWSSHDNTDADYSNFVFENCIFLSSFYDNAPVLRLGSTNSTTGVKNVRLTNCHIGGKIVLNDNASHPNNYALILFKSGNPTIESTTGTITIDPVIIQ